MPEQSANLSVEHTSSPLRVGITSSVLALSFFGPCNDCGCETEAVTPCVINDTQRASNVETRMLVEKATRFFIDARTENGLTLDRVPNGEHRTADRAKTSQPIASLAATGYGLSALPLLVEQGEITKA
jgi:hypothetical protein